MAVRWLLEDALGKVKALQEAAGTLKLLSHWQRMSLGCEHPVAFLQARKNTVFSLAAASASGVDARPACCCCLLLLDLIQKALRLLAFCPSRQHRPQGSSCPSTASQEKQMFVWVR